MKYLLVALLLLSACTLQSNPQPAPAPISWGEVSIPMPSGQSPQVGDLVAYTSTIGGRPLDDVFGDPRGYELRIMQIGNISSNSIIGPAAARGTGGATRVVFDRQLSQTTICGRRFSSTLPATNGAKLEVTVDVDCRSPEGRATWLLWLPGRQLFGSFSPPADAGLNHLVCDNAHWTISLYNERVAVQNDKVIFLISNETRADLLRRLHCLAVRL
jgi:hypothetical protein